MNIDMLHNGMDSLKRGFSSYHEYAEAIKEKSKPSLEDYYLLKQAVLSTHHGVEILLKHILYKKSEFLIVDEIDGAYQSAYKEKIAKKYQSVFQTSKANKVHTITYDEALSRVENICNVDISKKLKDKLDVLNVLRNALTHAEATFDDTMVDGTFDGLLLELDVLFRKSIGSEYSTYYGYSEIKANYDSYMQYLSNNKMLIKKKTVEALCTAQEKTEQYSGQNEVIYVDEIKIVKKFMTELQKNLDFGMDMYNEWCSGKTKVKVLSDGHISFWADDNNGEYIIKFKSMTVCIPKITSNESPTIVFESDEDTVEDENRVFITESEPDYLEGLVIQGNSGEADIVEYDPRKIAEYNMRWDCDDVVNPRHYQCVRFLKRKIFCFLNIQGLAYWNFGKLLRATQEMTGIEVADKLKESLSRRG